ncbi:MAG: SpoIVB peptidase S55 domain-containing protein [Bryobacter sp.]|nr:SpoIVB peptidase S55 domain-containing protein [Bryobacter sp.]
MTLRYLLSGVLLGAFAAQAQAPVLPLSQIRPDQEGTARTVFRGEQVEEFPLRILGVMRNSGPGQSLILARLLTERLEQTGVMQGMSGSPVFIEGKLAGAIAFSFPFAKEPIAGIRPIEEMLAIRSVNQPAARVQAKIHLGSPQIAVGDSLPAQEPSQTVLTPVRLAGFGERVLNHFADHWRRLGLVLQQGLSGSVPATGSNTVPPTVKGGDMIAVHLMRGDMVAGAEGTVTHREGNRIYAFGHRFLAAGDVDFPFAKAEVLTPLPNYNSPFKISQSLGEAGAIRQDADAGIVGELGAKARMIPVALRIDTPGGAQSYQVEMVRHAVLSPLLLQMSAFSALDHLLQSVGEGTVEFAVDSKYSGDLPVLRAQGRYAGDANLPLAASLSAAIPTAYVSQQMGSALLPEAVTVSAKFLPERDQWAVEGLKLSRQKVDPGDAVDIEISLVAGAKRQVLRESFRVPAWVPRGQTLTVSLQDALTANLLDFRAFYQPGGPAFADAKELIETLNRLHPAGKMYLRVLRSAPAYQSGVEEMANLPHSVATLFQRQAGQYPAGLQAKLLDKEVSLPSGVGSGSRTATLEIEK